MKLLSFESVCFRYPGAKKPTLSDVSFTLNTGDFAVLCGPTGTGKTTLLRSIKPELSPTGDYSGTRMLKNVDLADLTTHESAYAIGYVMQRPASQIVTDSVWHELAFGLENQGVEAGEMRRRIAETAQFFGIQTWFNKKVSELSGGQKQILNLASIMVMQPKILVLDEPTSQLDPIAAKEFLMLLQRINIELGCTIVIAEHSLDEVLRLCNKVLFLESGTLKFAGAPADFAQYIDESCAAFTSYLPTSVQLSMLLGEKQYAFSIREARRQLAYYEQNHTPNDMQHALHTSHRHSTTYTPNAKNISQATEILTAKNIWFRYSKNDEPILKNLSFSLKKGTIHAIVGGNGSGKTTLLYVLAQALKPLRGSISCEPQERRGLLSQDPQTMFVKDTVIEELQEMSGHLEITDYAIRHQLRMFRLEHLALQHPYDLSGGEMQQLALAKLMLVDPTIMLLDEPTKGHDPRTKELCGTLLKDMQSQGKTVVFVSHDLDFVAQYADVCSLIFNGEILSTAPAREFFERNTLYTTSTYRITRGALEHCVTLEDVKRNLSMQVETQHE